MPRRYSTGEKVVLLEAYLRSGSCDEARKEFGRRFPHVPQPFNSTILRLMEKFRKTGNINSIKPLPQEPSVLTGLTLTEIQGLILENPSLSVRKLSQQVHASKTTVHRALRLHLGMCPYRATVTHQLLPTDLPARVHFCEWISLVTENDPHFLHRCYFSDEAWFHLDGYVNAQNSRHWSTENPHVIVERPLHPIKVGVWAAMSATRIFIVFFDCTVNAVVYQRFLDEFATTFTENDIYNGWFQQDNATAHTARTSMNHVRMYFGERVISKGLWPARSPDLSPPDYFLWGYLKDKVYENGPRSLNELRENITAVVNNISADILHDAVNSLVHRARLCIDVGGQHFQHL
jgi:AraC-like DNA-binding protein